MRKISDPASEVCLAGLEEFQAEFLRTRREEMAELNLALKEQNFAILSGQAHRWRGFSAPYGFQELASLAQELEDQALSRDAQSCGDILLRVADYLGSDD